MMTTKIPAKQVKFGQRVLRSYGYGPIRQRVWIIVRVGGFVHDGQDLVELYVLRGDGKDVTYLLEADEEVEVIV